MAELVEHSAVRAAAYALVAIVALGAWVGDRRRPPSSSRWPTFWLLTAGLFVVLAIGRWGELGDAIADLGRERARSAGWYDGRRRVQAPVVLVLAGLWTVVSVVAIWRVPERRRRYLQVLLATVTVVCFALVRLVSLHHVDTVLHRWQIAGLRVGTVTEYGLLAVACAAFVWSLARSRERSTT